MTISEQITKLKNNWLIILLIAIAALMITGGGNLFASSISSSISSISESMGAGDYQGKSVAYDRAGIYPVYPPTYNNDFAPEISERKIAKTTTMSTEVRRGGFDDAEAKINNIVTSSNSILLNQNSNSYGTGLSSYKSGTYSIKVESGKYDSVIAQLKDVGIVKSFYENAEDVTGQAISLEDQIKFEKDKLKRYQTIFDSATSVSDKISLIGQISSQERTLKYLEDALQKTELRVSYSTITLSLTEAQSGYANLALVKLSQLVRSFVDSVNSLLTLIFTLLPWAVALLIIRFVWKMLSKQNKLEARKGKR